jgi:putative ABC transport system permease protein
MRYALRSLRKSPGFSALVITVLALGMGANAALFSIIDRVLLHPFNYRDPGRLVDISGRDSKRASTGISPAGFDFWQSRVPAFEQAAIWHWRDFLLTGVEDPQSLWALEVSQHTFDILGEQPLHGRLFRPDDFRKDSPPVAIIGYRFWQRHFNGDTALIGRQILLDGQGYTVAGIMGPDFMFHRPGFEVWVPLNPFRTVKEDLKTSFSGMARLRPGATIEQAQREMDAISPAIPKAPGDSKDWHAALRPYADEYVGESRRALYILWSAVLFVLLIACANAANLLLARASNRRREFAVRASLGAGRWRLVRQVIAESLLLGMIAGVAGSALGSGLLRVLHALSPARISLNRSEAPSLTPAALLVTLAVVLATTVLCAIPSCWDLRRSNLSVGLRASSRSTSADRASRRTRSVLVAFEIALSVTLLIGAGVMLESLFRLLQVPLGFQPDHVLTARVAAPPQLKTKAEFAAYFDRVLDRVNSIPGTRSSAMVTVLPLGNLVATTSFNVEGQPKRAQEWQTYSVRLRSVSPGYFETMGVRILKGRPFDGHDTGNAPGAAIVNEDLARHYWGSEDPIGKHVSRDGDPKPEEWLTVVGMIESARDGLRGAPGGELYRPYTQEMTAARATSVVVRTHGDPLSIAPVLRQRIHAINPDQPVTEIKSMETWVQEAVSQPRFNTVLLEIFAGLALVLAISGVFAVVSYAVTQRTHEIGIRGALGATVQNIVAFVIGLGLRPVLIGALIGVAGAIAATRALKAQLFETSPLDPVVFAVVLPLLLVAAAAAALIPARRAARIDPAITLRSE